MHLITFEDIVKLNIAPTTCYKWTVEMIAHKNDTLLPPKISMKPTAGIFCNIMPSIIPAASGKMGGVKIVTRYPTRSPSLDSKLLLMDADSGEFLALMDGDWITTMRTGAVAAHSVCLFAQKNFSVMGMLGLGNVSRATLMILAELMPERKIEIKLLRYKGQEESFARRFATYPNLQFRYVDSYEALVRGSEVVLSGATYLPEDICEDEAFDEGVLVQPIHTLGFTNCDLFFDKVFADDYSHVNGFKNFSRFRYFAEVCDVVNGKKAGRETDQERILAYNIGISIHDINFATHIYQMLKDDSEIEKVDLKEPVEKYWV